VVADVLLVVSRCVLAFMVELFDAFAHAFVGKGARADSTMSRRGRLAPGEAPDLASRRPRR
jgi:hypothetical protein